MTAPTISPGAFGAHWLLVGPRTKDSKPARNEGEDLKKTAESQKSPGTCLHKYKHRPTHRFTSWHHWGLSGFGCCPFLPALILNLRLRHLNMSGASSFAGAHHFVARNNAFIEAQTVSRIFTKGLRQAS
jgi:hypothetical protein